MPAIPFVHRPTDIEDADHEVGGPAEGVGDGVTGGASDGVLTERLGLANAVAAAAP